MRAVGAMNVTLVSRGELCGLSLFHMKKKKKNLNFLVLSSVLKELISSKRKEESYTHISTRKAQMRSGGALSGKRLFPAAELQEYSMRRGIIIWGSQALLQEERWR